MDKTVKGIAIAAAAINDNQEQRKYSAMISIKDAAKMLGISYSTLHRLVQSEKIGPQLQVSANRKVIPLDAIESYIENCYKAAA